MNTIELKIDPELRDLLPPLGPEALAGLEADILRDGCTDPLTVWDTILVDGHHRYAICKKHDIPFTTTRKKFDSLVDAKIWMCDRQDNRRNLNLYQRGLIALKMKPVLAEKAKQNQRRSKGQGKKGSPNLGNLKTQDALAKRFKISKGTLGKIEFLEIHADVETKTKLRSGQFAIDKAYKRLKAEIESQTQEKPQNSHESKTSTTSTANTVTEQPSAESRKNQATKTPENSTEEEVADNTEQESDEQTQFRPGSLPTKKYVGETQLKPIPRDRPDILVANLIAFFPEEFVMSTAFEVFKMMSDRKGKKYIKPYAQEISKKYGRGK